MYMRLLGYPAESIALLTMYNGQKQLLKDIVRKRYVKQKKILASTLHLIYTDFRCAWNPAIGWPAVISTVDRFQGQQADCTSKALMSECI